ncbi:MAG: magnesium chelatase subunit D [Rhodoferax sp.]
MNDEGPSGTVAALFAVDPAGLGGVALRARAGGHRETWLQLLRSLLPPDEPWRRIPLHADDSRLLGGLDLAATLHQGRPVAQTGLLAQCHGGIAVLASAERVQAGTAARLAQVLDSGEAVVERNGLSLRHPARLGLVALDEGSSDDEMLPARLRERMAFLLDLPDGGEPPALPPGIDAQAVADARRQLRQVSAADDTIQALCGAALALGVDSLRAPMLALRVARASAALDGRAQVNGDDARLAAALVLAPRATRVPEMPSDEPPAEEPPPDTPPPDDPAEPPPQDDADSPQAPTPEELDEVVLQAAQAAIPPGLLAALQFGQTQRTPGASAGGSGAQQHSKARGRPLGARRGELGAGVRLHVVETLRAAAPWQGLRRREAALRHGALPPGAAVPAPRRVEVRREDFHVSRFKQRRETTTIFVVDASGSAALHRLAEAKGAVELLLADCYVRRDRVAMLAFRGKSAELMLPPTRSLARAKRSLAGLPGGGGTPLAAGVDAACALALSCTRRGETPILVVLTDGRANIARDGSPGRERAGADALAAARAVRAAGLTALLVDTSAQPQPVAERLAAEMGAAYLPLPHAGAGRVNQAIRLASARPAR